MAGWELVDVERGFPYHTLTYTNDESDETFIFNITHDELMSDEFAYILQTKGHIPDAQYVKELYQEKARIYINIGRLAMSNLKELRTVGPDTHLKN